MLVVLAEPLAPFNTRVPVFKDPRVPLKCVLHHINASSSRELCTNAFVPLEHIRPLPQHALLALLELLQ